METPTKTPKGSFATPMRIPPTPHLTRLGLGTGVEVMLMKRSPRCDARSPWALKRLNKRCQGVQTKMFEDRILYEAEILKQLSHPNIVGFRDLIKDKDGHQCLAMEDGRVSLGDLLEERFANDEGPLPYQELKKMTLDVAQALRYLHTDALILHGDLKSFNVLVKEDTFKLCDFGVSVPIDKEGFIDTERHPKATYTGTDLWSAPEVLEDPSKATTMSEMFSFGLLIYEGIALVPPHTLASGEETSIISVKDSDDESMEGGSFSTQFGTRPALPEQILPEEYNTLIGLFFLCTHADEHQRPSAREVVKYIQTLQ